MTSCSSSKQYILPVYRNILCWYARNGLFAQWEKLFITHHMIYPPRKSASDILFVSCPSSNHLTYFWRKIGFHAFFILAYLIVITVSNVLLSEPSWTVRRHDGTFHYPYSNSWKVASDLSIYTVICTCFQRTSHRQLVLLLCIPYNYHTWDVTNIVNTTQIY